MDHMLTSGTSMILSQPMKLKKFKSDACPKVPKQAEAKGMLR